MMARRKPFCVNFEFDEENGFYELDFDHSRGWSYWREYPEPDVFGLECYNEILNDIDKLHDNFEKRKKFLDKS